jgi:hypothetical protein
MQIGSFELIIDDLEVLFLRTIHFEKYTLKMDSSQKNQKDSELSLFYFCSISKIETFINPNPKIFWYTKDI